MAFLTKSAWTVLGTDLGYRRIAGQAVPDNYDNNSVYVNRIPVNYSSPTDYTAFETTSNYQTLITGSLGQQSATVFGKFNFGAGAKGAFLGAGVRSQSSGGVLTAGYYGTVRSDAAGVRDIYLHRIGTTAALAFTGIVAAVSVDDPIGVRIYIRDDGADVRLDVQYSVDGVVWVAPGPLTNFVDTATTLTGDVGNWFVISRIDNAHTAAVGDYVFLDNCTLDTQSVS